MKSNVGIIGRKILGVRRMTEAEASAEGWDDSPHGCTVLILEGGALLYPSQDDEGNGPGALFGICGGKRVAY